MSKLQITLRRSTIGYQKDQEATARALGLRKRGATVVQSDTESVRGMIFKIRHLLDVTPLGEPLGEGDEENNA